MSTLSLPSDHSVGPRESEVATAEIAKWKGLYEIAERSKINLKSELEAKLETSEGVRVGIQDELKKLLISNSTFKEELGMMKAKADKLEAESKENKGYLDEAVGEILWQEEELARLQTELARTIADSQEKDLKLLKEKDDEIQAIEDVGAKSTAEILEKHLQDLQRCNDQIKEGLERRQELETSFAEMGGIVDQLQTDMDKLTSERDKLPLEKVGSDHLSDGILC